MAIKIETPPALRGTSEQQLQQVYAFLFRLSENLNVALNEVTPADSAKKESVASGSKQQTNKSDGGYDDLRALIINTAENVKKEMTYVWRELTSDYEAISEQWGTYRETIKTTIEETAESVVTKYDYDARIESVQNYVRNTSGYIKQGFIEYDSEGDPIIGIAIGQNLQYVNEVIGQLDATQSCAFYTAGHVSFRINGQEVAYVSNQKLYIREAEITTGNVTLGGQWQLTTAKGFAIKWVGGDI